MQFPGEKFEYRGWVLKKYENKGQRLVDIEMDFRREGITLGQAWATFVVP